VHILRVESRSIDGTAEAVDLGHTPADIVVLSFTDTDLSVVAAAWEQQQDTLPSLRLANLSALRHPFSIDRYLDTVIANSRFVLVRLLGGKDYWRYGCDELEMLARERGLHLAIVPGDDREDPRLDDASTLPHQALRRISGYFSAGGVQNILGCLRFAAGHFTPQPPAPMPAATPAFGTFAAGCRAAPDGSPVTLLVFYRAWLLAADTAPIIDLADTLAAHGARVECVYVTSLKDEAVRPPLHDLLSTLRPDVIYNLTAFSARVDLAGSVLDAAGSPVIQCILSNGDRQQWSESQRGLGPADLAMNVVMPELDGRIVAGAIAFKAQQSRSDTLQFSKLAYQTERSGVDQAVELGMAWCNLRRTPRADRRVACVLSDYPAKSGRAAYAVGLDTVQSVCSIVEHLRDQGFDVGAGLSVSQLTDWLITAPETAVLSVEDYRRLVADLPEPFISEVNTAWGDPSSDPCVRNGQFWFRQISTGKMTICLQPDRGNHASRKGDYHSAVLAPRHGYVACYLWLRREARVHAIIHCGTHGTLEWLPGKAVALSPSCHPQAVLGPVPLIYPFIVNNPGEAAQAKRRTASVTIGHLSPPLIAAGTYGATAELESLFDEYAEAQTLDPPRATRLATAILARAGETGLAAESGIAADADPNDALTKLDAWLCDLKDMRIGDGLHVFGVSPNPAAGDDRTADLLARCGPFELSGILAALDGRFVQPGPGGAPARGRTDVLPTGRNLFNVDPRSIPTRTAWEIGTRTAAEMLIRHLQDQGEWPKRLVLDLWGSATMRTGGDDMAQALALLGVRPTWDTGSNRVSGFELLPLAMLDRPRIDVTLRISGLFRDVFPAQITLFNDAVRAVAALDEAEEDNPIAAAAQAAPDGVVQRVFGGQPGTYGVGLSDALDVDPHADRADLGRAYLAATGYAYGLSGEPVAVGEAFADRVASADAYLHVQDLVDQDLLGVDTFAEHEGGFAAAAATLGNFPALYHADSTRPDDPKIRTLRQEVARVLRARATNPTWIAGQMRHGFRGAAEIAQAADSLFAYAVLADVVDSHQFDLLFDATLGDPEVLSFLRTANPAATRGMARKLLAATHRGLWLSRRNSAHQTLVELAGGSA
jgi:cobaltochelatase CobN